MPRGMPDPVGRWVDRLPTHTQPPLVSQLDRAAARNLHTMATFSGNAMVTYWTKTLIPTLREVPAEAEVPSHRLMLRAGLRRPRSSISIATL